MSAVPTPTDLMLLDLDERPWAAFASCRTADPDVFFPSPENDPAEAVRICKGCPVMLECRDWAFDTRVYYGVWGGLTERERRRALRRGA